MQRALRSRSGFSLLEISLVLVIIGLIVGGILTAEALIRSAALRSVVSDYQRFGAATNAFKTKYGSMPGDLPGATKFWGAQAGAAGDGVDAACAALTTPATGTATCNGDGSGFVADGCTVGDVRDQWYESYRAWQHLTNAEMLEGSFSGNSGSARTVLNQIAGVNAPKSKLSGAASWTIRSFAQFCQQPASNDWFDRPRGNIITVGNNDRTVGEGDGPEFTPEEAYRIDAKIDDKKPGKGLIQSFPGVGTINPGCTVSAAADTDYVLTAPDKLCTLLFYL